MSDYRSPSDCGVGSPVSTTAGPKAVQAGSVPQVATAFLSVFAARDRVTGLRGRTTPGSSLPKNWGVARQKRISLTPVSLAVIRASINRHHPSFSPQGGSCGAQSLQGSRDCPAGGSQRGDGRPRASQPPGRQGRNPRRSRASDHRPGQTALPTAVGGAKVPLRCRDAAPPRFSGAFREAVEAELPSLAPAVVRTRFHFRETGSVPAMVEVLDKLVTRPSQGVIVKLPTPSRSPTPSTGLPRRGSRSSPTPPTCRAAVGSDTSVSRTGRPVRPPRTCSSNGCATPRQVCWSR